MSGPSELDPQLFGLHGLNSFAQHDSSSRSVMFGSHFSQRLVISGATEKRIQSGVETELAKYTFNVKAPCDCQVIRIIDRYPRRNDAESIPFNPETIVIYEDSQTKEIGFFSIPYFKSYHQYFGFKMEQKSEINKLMPGAYIPKDTIFADSPSVTENGGYAYGVNLQVAYMSHPAVSEDGVLISEDALDKLKFKVYETRIIEFGSNAFPLNLYGTATHYKPFPEIGEAIREDGVLMMLREYDYDLMPVEISALDVTEPDFIFDKAVYVRGPGGRVVDIKVIHDENDVSPTPAGVMVNVDKYARGLRRFYQDIIDTYNQIRHERKRKYGESSIAIKPELNRLIVEGMAILAEQNTRSVQKLNRIYRKAPVDDYRVEITVEYELRPTLGNKITCGHGG